MTLEELKQKKESGAVSDPNELRTLTAEEIRKIMPNKEENTGIDLINQELDDIQLDFEKRTSTIENAQKELEDSMEEELEDVIFDAPLEDISSGMMSEEESDKLLAQVYTNAVTSIKEDPNIQAGINAVSAVSSVSSVAPENLEINDLLKELDVDDEDEEDEEIDIIESDDEEDEEESQKKMLKEMQTQVEDIIKPFNNVFDLKSFTISTKPKSVSKVLKNVEEGPTATWVLLDSGVPFTCTALGAVEIENLDPNKTNAQNGRIEALKQMYGTLFRHYTSANKPSTLEAWVKTISYSDQDNLIFGFYKATFGMSNLITYACDKCKEVKIKNVPIDECIKYKDDKTKKEVEQILKYGDPSHKSEIKAKLIQVSDNLAVSIKNPSIYNIVFEFGVLDAEFTNKFADVLGTVGYIENFYEIDVENRTLIPIETKEDPTNITKSVKRRIRSKVEMLKGLTPDQYQILTGEIAKISMNAERITYCQPEHKCEKCGNVIEETEMSAQNMLFIRHQLALIKTLSIE